MTRREALFAAVVIILGLIMTAAERESQHSRPLVDLHGPIVLPKPPKPPKSARHPRIVVYRAPSKSRSAGAAKLLGSQTLEKALVSGARIMVIDEMGDLQIETGSGNQVKATLRLETPSKSTRAARKLVGKYRLDLKQVNEGEYRLSISGPSEEERCCAGLATRMHVSVPEDARVLVEKIGGLVKVTGVNAGVALDGRSCRAEISGTGHTSRIKISQGELDLSDVTGDVAVEVDGCSVKLRDVTASVEMDSSFSNLSLQDMQGALTVSSLFGRLEADGIEGRITVRSKQTPMTLSDLEGAIKLEGRQRPISVTGARGELVVKGSKCRLTFKDTTGALSVTNASERVLIEQHTGGKVTINNRRSPVIIRNSEGPIVGENREGAILIEDCRGLVDMKNHMGDIHLLPTSARSSEVSAATSNGNLWVYLPPSADVRFSAAANGGRIEGSYPGLPEATRKSVGGTFSYTLNGAVGRKRNNLSLSTERGDIRILDSSRIAGILKRISG